jgi:uncharacterized protein YbjT (DUF2867 family)
MLAVVGLTLTEMEAGVEGVDGVDGLLLEVLALQPASNAAARAPRTRSAFIVGSMARTHPPT